MKLQKRRHGDQYSEHVSQLKRHAYANIRNETSEATVSESVREIWLEEITWTTSRPRTTTAGDDRFIILQTKRGRRQSASVIAQQLSTATGR
ncbi:hypothetical protein TNCV_3011651 [Trichonephila clavipes]|nr:hypothetical protein TNCV_3011651 [Trichonephila clavipes]